MRQHRERAGRSDPGFAKGIIPRAVAVDSPTVTHARTYVYSYVRANKRDACVTKPWRVDNDNLTPSHRPRCGETWKEGEEAMTNRARSRFEIRIDALR